jgi:two-component system chemotaxis response regulator CheB
MATDTKRPAVELVVLLASAGGLDALSVVLRDLPSEFPAAVVVQQHLGGISSVLTTILGRQTPHRVGWAQDGAALEPGQVVVCPPGVYLELAPSGHRRLRKTEARGERRFDVLLASVAASYGPRSVAAVLSGSGQDGAVGTLAMKRAGAVVIAQSPHTAQYPSMPIAAVRAGAGALPLHAIGRALAGIVGGAPLPEQPPHEKGRPATPPQCPAPNGDTPAAAEGESMDDESATKRGGQARLSPGRAPNSAATRAEAARLRATELQRRRHDLAEGFGATAHTVAVARRRAQESLRRAQLAHQAASEAAARWGH